MSTAEHLQTFTLRVLTTHIEEHSPSSSHCSTRTEPKRFPLSEDAFVATGFAMPSHFPVFGSIARALALSIVGSISPALEGDLRARFDDRREYARTSSSEHGTRQPRHRIFNDNRRAPFSMLFTEFIVLYVQHYISMADQVR